MGRQIALSAILVFALASSNAHADVAVKSWQPDSAQWHWGRDRQIDLLHTDIDIALDPAVVRVAGEVTVTFSPIVPELRHLDLDAARLAIESVRDEAGHNLEFTVEESGFTIDLGRAVLAGDTSSVTIVYSGEPTMGLYFIPSVPEDPDKIPMIWSQGEAEENRYWFPGYDYPNDKGTTSLSVRTPRPNVVVSNGRLVSLEENSDGTRTFHWACGVPNSTYLIAVAVGQFDSLVETSSGGVRCVHYCRKGMGDWLAHSMGETSNMMDYFEKSIGVRFPYEQYAQVMVTDFIHGGMENAGMTINTETTLHSARSHEFYRHRTNALLAHELAHQWFGDLVTLNDWSEAWLNEGFASYLEDLWIEHRWGKGRFQLSMRNSQRSGIGAARTRRSTVHHRYVHTDDLFSSYAYSRGAAVLHMIRGLIGDSLWWASVNRYVTDNYAKTVETVDLKRAIETTTGREMDWFFNQWIYHGGHPELSVTSEYDDAQGMLTIEVEQTQTVDEVTPLFRFPLEVEWVRGHERGRMSFEVTDKNSTFYLPLAQKPDYILIDPDGWLLADIEYKPSTPALLKQARDMERVLARRSAVAQLGEKSKSDEIVSILSQAMRSDPESAIRSAAIDALAELGGEDMRDSVIVGLADNDPSVRNTALYAVGSFEGDEVAYQNLTRFAGSNELDALRGSAIDAASMIDADRAKSLAKSAASRRSEKYTVEQDAFSALRRTEDESLIPWAMGFTRPGNPTAVRTSALGLISALSKHEDDGPTRHNYSLQLEKYLDDRNMNFRKPLMRAIGALGRPGAVDGLERVLRQSPQNTEWETAESAIKSIREKKPAEEPNTVARKIDEEADARKKLEERIEELERRLDAALENKTGKDVGGSPK
jgi:aminopeptidase N